MSRDAKRYRQTLKAFNAATSIAEIERLFTLMRHIRQNYYKKTGRF